MAKQVKIAEKKADDGSSVILFRDDHHGWFVGKAGDPALDPVPLGAFRSREAAQNWADRHFSGGTWSG